MTLVKTKSDDEVFLKFGLSDRNGLSPNLGTSGVREKERLLVACGKKEAS